MFIGHYAVAFATRRAVREVSLGTLFIATQLADHSLLALVARSANAPWLVVAWGYWIDRHRETVA